MLEAVGTSMVRKESSKYFLNLEKSNHVNKHMRKLNLDNVIITDPKVILFEQKRFYQELYTSSSVTRSSIQLQSRISTAS